VNKKKQKNFDSLEHLAPPLPTPTVDKSFLLLFFKKEALSSVFQTQKKGGTEVPPSLGRKRPRNRGETHSAHSLYVSFGCGAT
jgi:hypothetical protein